MVKLQSIKIKVDVDEYPDLSYLTDHWGGEEYTQEDNERLRDYNDGLWYMTVVKAEAKVLCEPRGRLEWLSSAGLWGVESDSSSEYFESIAKDELVDLKYHLEEFGIDLSNFDDLAEQALSDM